MTVELLLREFQRLAEAPDAIAGLRRLVIGLAVKGRLSEQRDSEQIEGDGDVAPWTSKLSRAAGLPRNWRTARLGDLVAMTYGKGLPAAERAAQGRVAVYGSNGIVGRTESALTEHAAIIVGRKGSAGALVIADGPSWTTDVAYYIVPPSYFDLRFLYLALVSLNLDRLGKGVKPGLSRSDAKLLPLPLPPIAEQSRIVAKVDELMAVCDQFEAALATVQKQRSRLLESLLHEALKGATIPPPRASAVAGYE